MDNPEIFVDPCFHGLTINLSVRANRLSIDGDVVKHGEWMKEPVFVKVEEGAIPPVAFRLSMVEAQALMDRLWMAGLRPTEGSGSAGALSATERHLKDMQTLVFEKNTPEAMAREVMDAIRHEANRGRPEIDRDMFKKVSGE
jgi:hypothetical protein